MLFSCSFVCFVSFLVWLVSFSSCFVLFLSMFFCLFYFGLVSVGIVCLFIRMFVCFVSFLAWFDLIWFRLVHSYSALLYFCLCVFGFCFVLVWFRLVLFVCLLYFVECIFQRLPLFFVLLSLLIHFYNAFQLALVPEIGI